MKKKTYKQIIEDLKAENDRLLAFAKIIAMQNNKLAEEISCIGVTEDADVIAALMSSVRHDIESEKRYKDDLKNRTMEQVADDRIEAVKNEIRTSGLQRSEIERLLGNPE
jgi:hypothetical protein